MGCCMSTSTRSTANKLSPKQNHNHHHHHSRRQVPESETSNVRAPPSPPHEEETVKEVLSETPIFKPTLTTTSTHHDAVELEEAEKKAEPKKAEKKAEPKKAEMMKTMVCTPPEVSEVSEVSEMYSTTTMSESFSANTMAERREDEVTSRQCGQQLRQRGDRSPARKRPYSGELAGAKERRVRSPGPVQRTNIGSRTVRGRESGQLTAKRRNVAATGIRRDPGEISGRRSRSPATRKESVPTRNVAARGQTLKMTGRSSDLSPAPVVSENSDNRHLTPENESIENPLVSLECFIFL